MPENTPRQDRDPVSLAPLTPEEALRALLAVDSDDPPSDQGDSPGQPDPDYLRQTAWFRAYEGLGLEEAKERAESEGRLVRVSRPGDCITLDLRWSRLNLSLDDDGDLIDMRPG